ncbi:MAG: right-handed parallel beta-helix repeat-containing protein, partial [Verrucomicrobiota bacterium]
MMKLYKSFAVSLFLFLLFPNPLAATTRYVSLTGAHVVPFTSWADAATNIQSAIDAAVDGDTIWVTNGVYSTGGKVMAGDLTNRVALDKALTVRSVNGPQGTVLTGAGATNGVAAVRCAWLTNGAVLQGFTLEAGATRTSGDNVTLLRGGGVWCASSNASVFNCVIRSNAANNFGGGAYQGKLVNCLISTNRTTAGSGGAACDVILVNCTVVSNGNYGVYQTAPNLLKITNSIVYFNAPANFPGGVSCYNSCTTPLPTGSGNFTNQPGFFLDALHLTSASPCRCAGLSVASGTDIFGNAWATPPSIGCAEWQASPFIPVPRVELTGDPVGFTVSVSAVGGEEPFSFQWLKDGMPLQNDGHFSGTETIGLTAVGI